MRLPDDFQARDGAALLQGLVGLWPKFLPYVLSFGVLGLRWLSNIEVRSRAEYVNREYANWWLLYLFLITCVPFTTIVVGRFAHIPPAIWLYAGHTLLIAAGRPSSGPDHAASGAGRPSATPADIGVASDRLLAAGDRHQLRESAGGAVGAGAEFCGAGDQGLEQAGAGAGLNRRSGFAD